MPRFGADKPLMSLKEEGEREKERPLAPGLSQAASVSEGSLRTHQNVSPLPSFLGVYFCPYFRVSWQLSILEMKPGENKSPNLVTRLAGAYDPTAKALSVAEACEHLLHALLSC